MQQLSRITLDTNPEDCNLRCIMCEEHSKFSNYKNALYEATGIKARRMPSVWIDKIFKEAKKLDVKEIIPSTMGEPLLFPEIDKFFQLAAEYDIKINLTTNGTFPKKTTREWAELIIPVTSDTKISLNGATKKVAENIMTGLNFDRQIENIKTFTAYRDEYYLETRYYSRVTLQLTFLRNNMHEISEIVKLASSIGIDRIKGHHLWTHFEEIRNLSYKDSKESIRQWNIIVDSAKEAVEKYRKPNGDKICLVHFEKLTNNETREVLENCECPFLGKELWISATGKISPCCAPDKERDALGDFGNYKTTSIQEVINSSGYIDLANNYRLKPLCQTCVMRKPL
jgi:MoaA/NifB/PqqE/SkfB family radical SAM enzyme